MALAFTDSHSCAAQRAGNPTCDAQNSGPEDAPRHQAPAYHATGAVAGLAGRWQAGEEHAGQPIQSCTTLPVFDTVGFVRAGLSGHAGAVYECTGKWNPETHACAPGGVNPLLAQHTVIDLFIVHHT
jgi:hypothetical protein